MASNYVDGGLLDNGGVSVAVEAGAEQIYMLSATYGGPSTAPVTNMAELLERSFHVVASEHIHRAILRYEGRARFVVIEDKQAASLSALDFRHPEKLIASGYKAAVAALDHHDALLAAVQLAVPATAPTTNKSRDDLALARWLRKPIVMATLQAFAWLDVTLQQRWERMVSVAQASTRRVPAPVTSLSAEKIS